MGLVVAVLAVVVLAYLLGTFPSAELVARHYGVDVTKSGSGNPGASNVMCKSIDRAMTITDVALWEKTGGRSGTFRREPDFDDLDL